MWKKTSLNVFKYSPEDLHRLYDERSEEWDDWLKECFLLICLNFHILNKKIVMEKQNNLIEYDLE